MFAVIQSIKKYTSLDEETVRFYVNDVLIGTYTYDLLGFSGLATISETFETLAKFFGLELQHLEEEE